MKPKISNFCQILHQISQRKKIVRKAEYLLIFIVLPFRNSKLNTIIFNMSPTNRFIKISIIFPNYFFFFDDDWKKWQPLWKKIATILFLLLRPIRKPNFINTALTILEISRDGANQPNPGFEEPLIKPGIYRTLVFSENYFLLRRYYCFAFTLLIYWSFFLLLLTD